MNTDFAFTCIFVFLAAQALSMLRKSFLLFAVVFMLRLTANAAVFVVTSNADSGSGTLRQALLDAAANGSVEKDFIHFNIADLSEVGRTIKVLTLLPDIPSNVDIDGTTQSGNKFGVSDTKVKILMAVANAGSTPWCMYIYNQSDVGIYGLLIDADFSLFQNGTFSSGIYIVGAQRLKIGEPGRGNVIKNFEGNIFSYLDFTDLKNSPVTQDVKVQANFIGINEDGKTICQLGRGQVEIASVKNFTLGGFNASEGNVIYGMARLLHYHDIRRVNLGNLIVGNNIFGLDYLGENPIGNLDDPTQTTSFAVVDHPGDLEKCDIFKNTFSGGITFQTGGFFTVRGNRFGTNITGTKIIPHKTYCIVLGYCSGNGKIGGITPDDQNVFAGCYQQDYVPMEYGGVIDNISSPGVEIVGNSFKCNNGIRPIRLGGIANNVPVIKSRTNVEIAGSSVANARVDLYYSIECDYCEPQVFIASVAANSSGDWKYTGLLTNNAIIAAATINGGTSEFTGVYFTNAQTEVEIGNACAGQSGYIRGITANGVKVYAWYNDSGTLIASTPNLSNAAGGKYHLIISDGYCSISSPVYEIKNIQIQINDANKVIANASCGASDGSITGLQATTGSAFVWKDEDGNIVGHDIDLNGVPAGKYTLTVTALNASCSEIYGPVTLINATGPNLNQLSAIITNTNCGQSVGSITGIATTGTGVLKYSWTNQLNQQVGTSKDLVNQPAGKYILQVTDDTQCGPVYTTVLEILEMNGITVDESAMKIIIASCSKANGAITGIKVPGATKYEWKDINNITVSTSVDLKDAPSGDYTFTASNNFGCEQIRTYYVGQQAATIYPVYTPNIINACYGINNGSISISANALVKSLRWTNNPGTTINGNGNTIENLAPGTYKLYFTDINGCESFYNSYTVNEIPELKINAGDVTNDNCDLKTGSIKNVQITGGSAPYTYAWFNSLNAQFASTPEIGNLGSGTYRLVVTDSRNCAQPFVTYTVQTQTAFVATPSASDIQVCSPGKTGLAVNNPSSAYVYRLYESENSQLPVEERADGRFTIDVKSNTSYFVSQLSGTCESNRTLVRVSVGISALDIANVFTPNADGINDVWKITGIENSPSATVQVFSRNGQLVFNSKGYATPFNGTLNGRNLPVGSYYYIINMGSACSVLSGALTIIR